MKKQISTIISIILIIIIAIFALMNFESVEVNFGFASFQVPLVLLILICLLIGALIIFLFSSTQNVKKNRQYKQLASESQKRQDDLNAEICELNNNLKELETRLKNSTGKQEIGSRDQQISDLQDEIAKLTEKLSSQK
ncbi:lipopolysaccharide assembly protein LapA domain-containing protein [Lentilactobacillus buchneri]|uniref:Lipopolysaccharide assembly protein A domain-containing protein n=1 Tax=Lentilactobacillus buchneri subsp. silagei CD034 TaxID=1071400 RepID=J9W6R7_LENBU|nr:lipopolysaccharide assembly protein LapA domain-containing protein [Lentilactobacillus buchneri]MCC6101989.1 lipopolysaccharide assembly protein LapA domain-containing protein [Lactobacillus sp.]AFR99885.1 hypothetical protein LBUCD034_0817 [Lentilactobacillus buchneri subsp. silagei CD034]MCT2901617.1 DUF1049 domain-containing protein [Lentilactobacillus buchneri]MCT3543406.1 DUF1049 domain-containing protein [Lentilactobacillus buchneri]MCT3543974.1 DUF1049 domain-containing protein [Lent